MKSKKLLVMVLVLLAGSIAFAQYTDGVEFHQYTKGDFGDYATSQRIFTLWSGAVQDNGWTESDMITLKVQKGSTVYITNYVDDWYGGAITDLGDPEYNLGYDMSARKYGYVYAEIDAAGNAKPVGDIYWGTGETTTVTYQNPEGPETQDVTGYLLGTFENDSEIFLVMTPNGYDGATVNTYDRVHDPDNVPATLSILKSRHVDPEDQAANARVNLGIGNYDEKGAAHEFVIGYVASNDPAPSGQPLPGVLTSCLIALGTTTIAARRRNRSRK